MQEGGLRLCHIAINFFSVPNFNNVNDVFAFDVSDDFVLLPLLYRVGRYDGDGVTIMAVWW